jgi:hypothetical protein
MTIQSATHSVSRPGILQIFFNDWPSIVSTIKETFRLNIDETNVVYASKSARLIASIPYLAGCEQCERTATLHLAAFVLAWRTPRGKVLFSHSRDDDKTLLERLELQMYIGGEQSIIANGKARLGLVMLNDYLYDMKTDKDCRKYNPLNFGKWKFDSKKNELLATISSNPCSEFDQIYSISEILTSYGWLD